MGKLKLTVPIKYAIDMSNVFANVFEELPGRPEFETLIKHLDKYVFPYETSLVDQDDIKEEFEDLDTVGIKTWNDWENCYKHSYDIGHCIVLKLYGQYFKDYDGIMYVEGIDDQNYSSCNEVVMASTYVELKKIVVCKLYDRLMMLCDSLKPKDAHKFMNDFGENTEKETFHEKEMAKSKG